VQSVRVGHPDEEDYSSDTYSSQSEESCIQRALDTCMRYTGLQVSGETELHRPRIPSSRFGNRERGKHVCMREVDSERFSNSFTGYAMQDRVKARSTCCFASELSENPDISKQKNIRRIERGLN
jgi:hypothetical protein